MRSAAVALPLAIAGGAGVVAAWSVPGSAGIDVVARVMASGVASVAGFVVLEWAVRRLAPLAILLRLTLVFPDRAPSRFAIALRSTSVRRLQEWACSTGSEVDPATLAEKVVTLASALNFHDRRTRGHSERTRAMSELLIDELTLSEAEANEIRWGAFLHDIGKLLVPAKLLNKPGAPTADEWEDLRRHPAEGERIVGPLRAFIGAGVDAVAFHHESYDGTGYPLGLRGNQIPFAARVVAVADSFEVMTAVRSYKRPMSAAAARAELVRESGRQFDPAVVRAFVNVSLGRLHWVLGIAAWLAELPFVGIVPRAAAQVGVAMGSGGSALSTATLTSVATASLGMTLVANPVMTHVLPSSASASQPPAVAVVASGASADRFAGVGLSPPPVGIPASPVAVLAGLGVKADPGHGVGLGAKADPGHGVGPGTSTDAGHGVGLGATTDPGQGAGVGATTDPGQGAGVGAATDPGQGAGPSADPGTNASGEAPTTVGGTNQAAPSTAGTGAGAVSPGTTPAATAGAKA